MNIKEFLESQKNLVDDFDAQVLLAHVLRISRPQLIAHPNAPLDLLQLDSATQAFARLKAGEPLPYILGQWEFFGLGFEVNEHVLIPRPETELLVEKAIAYLKNNPDKRNIIDVGTGSGIIAISIAKHIPDAKILATDISPNALQVAKRNAIKHGVQKQIEFVECDLLPDRRPLTADRPDNLSTVQRPPSIDFICANLPYIPTQTLHELKIYGKEPTLALDGGEDGLDLYRKLFSIVSKNDNHFNKLNNLVWLCEVEATQGISATNLAKEFFPNANVNLHQDLAGKDRLIEIIL
ncbi:MAG: peptide chain release factor N(5)-glutamine methyltransferase [Anaerolineales bacterium]|nr:peptide chain release factor N(5)-glutamine methyltransferase [Anaerolineales bacterium]